jgi:hypothetical protein
MAVNGSAVATLETIAPADVNVVQRLELDTKRITV